MLSVTSEVQLLLGYIMMLIHRLIFSNHTFNFFSFSPFYWTIKHSFWEVGATQTCWFSFVYCYTIFFFCICLISRYKILRILCLQTFFLAWSPHFSYMWNVYLMDLAIACNNTVNHSAVPIANHSLLQQLMSSWRWSWNLGI